MVDHTSMLNALHDQGVTGPLWQLYRDMYDRVLSRVKVDGLLSKEILEGQGIRQGGTTSADCFKAKSNRFLTSVRTHPESFKIGTTSVGIPTVADDNCLLSSSAAGTQTQLYMAQDDACRDRYLFSTTKSRVMLFDPKNSACGEKPAFTMNGSPLEYTDGETHLGLLRTPDGRPTEAVATRIQIGRRTAYSLMGAGLHGLNGVSPGIAVRLLKVYVLPAVLYGLEALVLQEKDIIPLEKAFRTQLWQVQHLPSSTAIPAVYLLAGCLPIEALYHQKVLTFFGSILHRSDSAEYDIVQRQLAIKISSREAGSPWCVSC
jgi:hypothetical protein